MLIEDSIGTLQNTDFSVCAFDDVPSYKKAVQGGFKKRDPNPNAFKMLPVEVLDEIGEATRVGSTRFELLVLSHLAYTFANTSAGEVQYEQGFVTSLTADQLIQSMQTTAEDGYARWVPGTTRSDLENSDGTRTKEFEAFYKRVVRGYKRLMKAGWVDFIGYVNEKFKGIYGSIWEIDQRLKLCAERLPDCPPPPPILVHSEPCREGPYVNAVDLIGKRFLSETSAAYTRGECCTAVNDRGTYLIHDNFCDVVAENQPDQPRHVSIGAFKPENTAYVTEDTSCTVPWMILESESGDIIDRHEATCRMLETMESEGVDLSQVVVTFSGNKSFHIRIPQGMFGNPVYRSVEDARRAISRFAYDNFDEHLDTNLFDPRHLVRCTGSKHEKGGMVKAYTGNEFLSYGLDGIMRMPGDWNPHGRSPRYARPDAWLMTKLIEASESLDRFWIMAYEDAPTISESGAFAAALKGCEENEQWHPKHVGRSKLCFVAACYLLKKYDEVSAWEELESVNAKNSPPLPQKELKTCFASAKRTINKSRR